MNNIISPLDSRYSKYTSELGNYFSENALNNKRVEVEIKYFIFLLKVFKLKLEKHDVFFLQKIYSNFSDKDVRNLKKIESITVHDVKAVEYFIRKKISKKPSINKYSELIHFGLTSEDVNNLSYARLVKSALKNVIFPAIFEVETELEKLASFANIPMLAKTHGQNASPTNLKKELKVFINRIKKQEKQLKQVQILGKLNGATGTFAAHKYATDTIGVKIDWPTVSKQFIENELGLKANNLTTQIESHDWDVELFYKMAHLNGIFHNLCTDIWLYIAFKYFIQKSSKNAVGSSTMPHKINPINFENAEGNLEISNSLFLGLASSLVTTRLQRDLTDSTVQRNIGVAFGYFMVAMGNLNTGLNKLVPNNKKIAADLDSSYEVLAEPLQSVLRLLSAFGKQNVNDPYKLLKAKTKGKTISKDDFSKIVSLLIKDEKIANKIKQLKPNQYTGIY